MSAKIQILPPEEAKKIAAGEVIDRPAALAREFIDNAIDAGAASVELSIEGGGIRKLEVIDDGAGMDKDDLLLCIKTHATSKIRSLNDLSRAATLGFRGEALAAAAAVARLEILSATENGAAWLLAAGPGGGRERISPGRRARGTTLRAFGLFDTIPARKRFLKREGSESALCRQVFTEKALAFPGLSFRFVQDDRLTVQALPRDSYRSRFGDLVLSANERVFLHEIHAADNGFAVCVVFGGPELFRRDRRQQYIFVNNRRVQDYSLMQALEYGLAGFFPNGTHPAGAVFVNVDPALADFNIHPAKREVRFADPGAIHHAVTSVLANYTRNAARFSAAKAVDSGAVNQSAFSFPSRGGDISPRSFTGGESARLSMEALLARRDEFAPLPGGVELAAEPEPSYSDGIRLIGRAFDLFIIVERGEKLFLIDQHAAHERVLYNRFLAGPITKEELLVAIPFTTEGAEDDGFLLSKREELAKLGIVLESEGGGAWRVEALPAGWKTGDGETVNEILSLRRAGANMAERWAASLSCRAAIKDGGFLDNQTALTLAAEVLAIPEGRCPHGRPIWVELSRDDLFRAVRRE